MPTIEIQWRLPSPKCGRRSMCKKHRTMRHKETASNDPQAKTVEYQKSLQRMLWLSSVGISAHCWGVSTPQNPLRSVLCQEHGSEAEAAVAKIGVRVFRPKGKDSKVVRAGKRRSCWDGRKRRHVRQDRQRFATRLKPKLAVCGAVARTTGLHQPVPRPY